MLTVRLDGRSITMPDIPLNTLRAADMTGKTPVRLEPNPTAIPPQSNTSGQPLVEPMQ